MKINKIIIALISVFSVGIVAGPIYSAWTPIAGGASVSTITSAGSYNLNTFPYTDTYLNPFTVLVSTSSTTDTVKGYLADERGVIQSDTLTINGSGSGYMAAGGIARHWVLTGKWRLVLTKAAGNITAKVSQ